MTTTLVKDSIVGDAWITQTAQACPVHRKIGDNGQPTGDILTGPVRLAFVDDLWDGSKPDPSNPGKAQTFSATLLFTPLADFKIFYEEYYAELAERFASYYNPHMNPPQYVGVHSPFHDQAEKANKYMGYTPGCVFLNSGSQYKPPIVDIRGNPIVDKNKIYPGVWAICGVKRYTYGIGKNPQPKKGVAFGLQTVMLIGDDTRFGGGAPDAKEMFSGINITAPIVRPDALASMPQGGPPAPGPGIPGYTTPGFGQPGAPAPVQQPPGFIPPGAPAGVPSAAPMNSTTGYATPATPYPSSPAPGEEEDLSFLNA